MRARLVIPAVLTFVAAVALAGWVLGLNVDQNVQLVMATATVVSTVAAAVATTGAVEVSRETALAADRSAEALSRLLLPERIGLHLREAEGVASVGGTGPGVHIHGVEVAFNNGDRQSLRPTGVRNEFRWPWPDRRLSVSSMTCTFSNHRGLAKWRVVQTATFWGDRTEAYWSVNEAERTA